MKFKVGDIIQFKESGITLKARITKITGAEFGFGMHVWFVYEVIGFDGREGSFNMYGRVYQSARKVLFTTFDGVTPTNTKERNDKVLINQALILSIERELTNVGAPEVRKILEDYKLKLTLDVSTLQKEMKK